MSNETLVPLTVVLDAINHFEKLRTSSDPETAEHQQAISDLGRDCLIKYGITLKDAMPEYFDNGTVVQLEPARGFTRINSKTKKVKNI